MDLARTVTYRNTNLNDAAPQVGKPGLIGCSVDQVELGSFVTQQYIDKTNLNEGMDFQGVGNLSMGEREVNLIGTLYGETRGDLWDRLVVLRNALNPVLAYAEGGDETMGFLPLRWEEPAGTAEALTYGGQPVTWRGEVINYGFTTVFRHLLARPHGLHQSINRDKQGTNVKVTDIAKVDANALALKWTCKFTCRDPRVYGDTNTTTFSASASGTIHNAGDYPSLVDMTFILGAGAGTIEVEIGGAEFNLVFEAGTAGRTLRYRGWTKLLTLEDSALSDFEILRQDILQFVTPNSDTQHPRIDPGDSAWSVVVGGAASLQSGSGFQFKDAYA